MPRFLLEVPHEKSTLECNRAIDTFLRTGSHFLTHADWGCKDGVHSAFLIVEAETKEEARNIVPQDFRGNARVVHLTYFTPADMDRARAAHKL